MTSRRLLLNRLGSLPDRIDPVSPRVERRFVWDGILFERWCFPGPRDDIRAYFLLAEHVVQPAPVVLALHPHGRQFELGKSQVAGLVGEDSRAYGLAAARAGFGVLAPDMPGFEQRRPSLTERKHNYALQGENYERLLTTRALVHGATLQGWILTDLSACVDQLELDDRVDTTRLGAIGQSLGGQEVVFSMTFDSRICAGVTSCGFSLVRLLVERSISHNLALYLPGMLPNLDFDTLVAGIAPRPLRVVAGRHDSIYPVEGVEAVEKLASKAYKSVDAEGNLVFDYFDGGHDLPTAALGSALEWLQVVLA